MKMHRLVSVPPKAGQGSWKKLAPLVFLSLVVLIPFSFAASGQDDAPAHPGADVPPILKIGSAAPDFNLPGVDGKNHALKDYASSKVLAVIFSCNHCPVRRCTSSVLSSW